jgi:hypothetical protein
MVRFHKIDLKLTITWRMCKMRILKQRYESDELLYLRYLNPRMKLSFDDVNYLKYLEKGFEGEKKFDEILIRNLTGNWLLLNDLLFEHNRNFSQVDSLAISNGKIHHFEVKNNEGDHFIKGESWYHINKTEIKNPYQQLKRCETLLRGLLHNLRVNDVLESNLVFVNSDFFLYNAPMNLPIIYPPQINRYINNLNLKTTSLKDSDYRLAEKLLSLHIDKSPFTRKPFYHFEQLEKGIVCGRCQSLTTEIKALGRLICRNCGFEEDVMNGVLRNVEIFKFLFPERKITTEAIYEWCKVIGSRKTIRRILTENLQHMGSTRSTYFVPK